MLGPVMMAARSSLFAHVGVVRDEERVLQHALDDRMAAVVDLDDAAESSTARAAVVVVHRDGRQATQSVSSSATSRRGGRLDALGARAVDGFAQGGEDFVFERLVAIPRGQNLLLQVLELLR